MKIKKAIIITAGFGTRFLPISKTIQKEMLPIIDRPLIDYVVDDCIKAGIEEIIFVINEHNYQVMHYYQENKRLYHYLEKMNKLSAYSKVENIHTKAKFSFVKQGDKDQYGTAVPVKLAKKFVKDEDAFLVLSGDDMLFDHNGSNEIKNMVDIFTENNAEGLITCIEKSSSELHKYGIAKVNKKDGLLLLEKLIEKPAPGTAPSNLANISKYILTPKVFEIIDRQKLNEESKELYLTDTVQALAELGKVIVYIPTGEYLDGGNPAGWLRSNLIVAKNAPEIYQEIKDLLK